MPVNHKNSCFFAFKTLYYYNMLQRQIMTGLIILNGLASLQAVIILTDFLSR